HGAAWTFVLWGALHGVLRVFEEWVAKPRKVFEAKFSDGGKKIYLFISGLLVFALVNLGWIFFRANNVGDAFYIIGHLFGDASQWLSYEYLNGVRSAMQMSLNTVILPLIFGLGVMLFVWIRREHKKSIHAMVKAWPTMVRWSMYFTFSLLIAIMFIMGNSEAQFIYFQF
ncbi:MAG: hypothetical protein AB1Z19_07140, partial [Eubacteriales bacterium]